MSSPIQLPGDILVNPPSIPNVVVVPVQGPPGPRGPAGDSSEVLGFTYTTSTPATLHQIHHNLPYRPGGVVCHDADGSTLLGFTVSHVADGVSEVAFGVPVTPTIYLS